MTETPSRAAEAAELLRRAEEVLALRSGHQPDEPTVDTLRLVHQLAVHQIELDLQQQELRFARDQLAKTLASYVDLYDFAPAGYLTVDPDGIITQSNLAAARIVGLERARFVGRCVLDLIASEDKERFRGFIERTIELPGEHVCEAVLIGEHLQELVVTFTARRSAEGGACRMVAVDVTELREAQQVAAAAEELSRREETARMLHDTVLQRLFGVTTSLQALSMDPTMSERAVGRIEYLIDELDATIVNIRETIFEQQRAWSEPARRPQVAEGDMIIEFDADAG